jgi:hypothetical protein
MGFASTGWRSVSLRLIGQVVNRSSSKAGRSADIAPPAVEPSPRPALLKTPGAKEIPRNSSYLQGTGQSCGKETNKRRRAFACPLCQDVFSGICTGRGFKMLTVLLLLLAPHPFLADPPLLVRRSDFDCLVREIDTAPKKAAGAYVEIDLCPPRFHRYFYPVPPKPRPPKEPARTLRLDRAQLACIRTHRRNIAVIARPSGPDNYLLDFRPCRRSR